MSIAPRHLKRNFSRAAAQYDAHAWLQQRELDRVLTAALEHLPACARVLDIGCGTGQFSLITKQPRPDWQVVGIDLAYAMAEQARERCAVVQADAVALPIASQSVDGVISSLCMQWVADKPGMLREIRRVLKPGGVAIINTLGFDTLRELRAAAANTDVPLGLLEMESFGHYRALAAESGMQLISCSHRLDTYDYPSVTALLDSMRAIGAGNASDERPFISPGGFARMIRRYEADYGSARGIPATWEPILMVLAR